MEDLKKKIESILFVAGRALSLKEIAKELNEDEKKIKEALDVLIEEYKNRNSAIEIIEINGFYEMRVKPEFLNYASKFSAFKDLSIGALKTLALIVYKSPIKQSEIIKIQGNKAYEHIKKLEKKGLIISKKSGKTKLIFISPNFEKYFGLKIEEIKKLIEEAIGKDVKQQ